MQLVWNDELERLDGGYGHRPGRQNLKTAHPHAHEQRHAGASWRAAVRDRRGRHGR
jgi:hypothetical protein